MVLEIFLKSFSVNHVTPVVVLFVWMLGPRPGVVGSHWVAYSSWGCVGPSHRTQGLRFVLVGIPPLLGAGQSCCRGLVRALGPLGDWLGLCAIRCHVAWSGGSVPYFSPCTSLVWGLLLLCFTDDLPLFGAKGYLKVMPCVCPLLLLGAVRCKPSRALATPCTSRLQTRSHTPTHTYFFTYAQPLTHQCTHTHTCS
ncbi:hypothetical protein GOODEAATRI_006335 [Goodea atripinnis]|uniref:Uncharacterized protein n=1 Tax=Goodea atripinnis TaxID=208336 RepID=A0ABV0NHY6_9TELE